MSKYISRATFLKGMVGAAAALSAAAAAKLYTDKEATSAQFPCRILGPNMSVGHKIRNGEFALADNTAIAQRKKVVIVGGGIAGLSAAWWLKKHGWQDFVLLELEKEVGGNSGSGRNQVSAYPWGAHYIPLANEESAYVRLFFEETGIIESYDPAGQPCYNPLYLCHEPQERLFKDGVFSEGLVPKRGLQKQDKDELAKFFQIVDKFRQAKGADGKPAFAIPLALSSQDQKWTSLDCLSMADWLSRENFKSPALLWYIDYCCRDDYGSLSKNVSAWAGLHYFAGRRGRAANAEMNSVVTWPEGNGFVVNKLRDKVQAQIRTQSAVVSIKKQGNDLITVCADSANAPTQFASQFVVFAAPHFLAPHIISDYVKPPSGELAPTYAPWLVANITLKSIPDGRGAEICWDNVAYRSPSLGYVVANHQNISTAAGPLVITYYYPLAAQSPRQARLKLQENSASAWSRQITNDLESMHPGISQQIISMDIWPWGHGMISPVPGYIWGTCRQNLGKRQGNILFAHSDASGISNFEEAQFQGVECAKQILNQAGETT